VYVVFALCQTDRVRSRESVWVGYEFHKAVSDSLPTEEKDVAYNDFIRQSRAKALLIPHAERFEDRTGHHLP
jgi:hypothetical protein